MKKIIAFATLLLILFIPVGCKSAVKITENDVVARIDDKYFKESHVMFVNIGKVTNQIHHPAEYHVVIEYDGRRYDFDDESVYNSYEIGDVIKVIKEIKEYSDGSYTTKIKLK